MLERIKCIFIEISEHLSFDCFNNHRQADRPFSVTTHQHTELYRERDKQITFHKNYKM